MTSKYYNIQKQYKLSNKYIEPSNVGIYNIGKTCYINSILQCLYNIYELSDYLIEEKYNKDIKKHKLKEEELILLLKYKHYNKVYWDDTTLKSLNITNLINAINNTFPDDKKVILNVEEDAYIFLINTINKLHDILKYKIKMSLKTEDNTNNINYKTNLEKYITFFKDSEKNIYSEIFKLFYGTYIIKYKCLECNNTTTNFEMFNSISVDIKEEDIDIKLSHILKNYFREEEIEKECECCKVKVSRTTKTFNIFYLPNNLIIHIKRSKHEEEVSLKSNCFINYPINNLDLTKFVEKEESHNNYIYDLYSICNHIGDKECNGHYTSLVRSIKNEWIYYNDNNVINLSKKNWSSEKLLNSIVSKDAYILFYKRKFISY